MTAPVTRARPWCTYCGEEVEVPHACPQTVRGEALASKYLGGAANAPAERPTCTVESRCNGRRTWPMRGAP